jgi:hypothetical protein
LITSKSVMRRFLRIIISASLLARLIIFLNSVAYGMTLELFAIGISKKGINLIRMSTS